MILRFQADLPQFVKWLEEQKPAFVVTRWENGEMEYDGAADIDAAMEIACQYSSKGGQVEVLKGGSKIPLVN
jgi:hypothetical protein